MILSCELNHGQKYMFRIHSEKLGLAPAGLQSYLKNVHGGCHETIFKEGPRSSALKFSLAIKPVQVSGHEVSAWALQGLRNYHAFRTAHEKVQMCMLENDQKTIGIEVPIWLKEADLLNSSELMASPFISAIFNGEGVLTGHIDALAVDGPLVWIWDYKPNAHKEKHAATQVFFYALMLSKRSGVPFENFRCGYFDDKRAYLFRPELNVLNKQAVL